MQDALKWVAHLSDLLRDWQGGGSRRVSVILNCQEEHFTPFTLPLKLSLVVVEFVHQKKTCHARRICNPS